MLGFKLVTSTEEFWVQVLRNKYKVHGLLLMDIHRNSCSYLWLSIANIWSEVKKGIYWVFDDCRLVNFWNDDWLRDLGIRRHYYIFCQSLQHSLRVYDVVSEGTWNTHWLVVVLTQMIVKCILAYKPTSTEADINHLSWRWLSGGKFSVLETYKHLFASNILVNVISDELTWKVRAPQRVRTFL